MSTEVLVQGCICQWLHVAAMMEADVSAMQRVKYGDSDGDTRMEISEVEQYSGYVNGNGGGTGTMVTADAGVHYRNNGNISIVGMVLVVAAWSGGGSIMRMMVVEG